MRFFFGLLLVCSTSFAHAGNVHGILRVVKGDVQIKSGETGQMNKAKLGAKVFPKDVIVTGKEARAKVVMVDNNEINVSPESQIELQNYEYDPTAGKKEVLLNVIYGKVRSKVEQKYDGKTSKFQIKTPSAVAGVRGTDFMTSYNRQDNTSNVVTFRGRVEFGLPGPGGTIKDPVSVTPGTQASTNGNSAPSAPAPVDKKELAKMEKESNAETGGDKGKGEERQPVDDGEKKEKKDDKKEDKKDGKGDNQSKSEPSGEKKSEGTKESSSGPNSPSGKSPDSKEASSTSAPPPSGPTMQDRGPANTPSTGSGMMMGGDLAGSPGAVMPVINATPAYTPPPAGLPPTTQPGTGTTCGTACTDIIAGGKGKVTITINQNP